MKILVPKDINDITLEQYQKFAIINTDDQDEEFFIHKTISIFCDVDMPTVSKFPIKDAKEIAEEVQNVLGQNVPFTSRFEMNGVEYGFIPDLEKMSLGEFVDLENSLKDSKDFHKAASVMYRPVKKRFKELYSIEAYNPSRSVHEAFKKAPIGVISAAVVFLQYRERVTSGFPALYGEANERSEDYSREAQFAAKYGWFSSIYALSGGNATAIDKVTEMNHLDALLWLEFEKDKTELERQQYKSKY